MGAVPMGLVEIQGKGAEESTLLSPVTRTPCCAYRLGIMMPTRATNAAPGDATGRVRSLTLAEVGKVYLEDAGGRSLSFRVRSTM